MEEIVILNHFCFACGEELNSDKKSVLESTKHSDKQIYKYIETFAGISFDKNLFEQSSQAAVCISCLEKLEEYDRICLQAARIQEEIAEVFTYTQEKYRTDSQEFLKCKTCFEQCSNFDELNDHECIEVSDDVFELIEYAEESSADESKSEPMREPRDQPKPSHSHTCSTCHKAFSKKRDYQQHVKLAHLPDNAELFSCSQCVETFFVSDMELKLHNVVAHPVDPSSASFHCPVCDKAFTSKSLLNRHFGIHSANLERPHICEICGKSFFHYSSFQAHGKIHADIRDYQCPQCAKTFRSQSHLTRHLKTHTKQKDHECKACGSRFAERYNLTAHLKTHYGISRKKRQSISQAPTSE